jgi:hypothetical protein
MALQVWLPDMIVLRDVVVLGHVLEHEQKERRTRWGDCVSKKRVAPSLAAQH